MQAYRVRFKYVPSSSGGTSSSSQPGSRSCVSDGVNEAALRGREGVHQRGQHQRGQHQRGRGAKLKGQNRRIKRDNAKRSYEKINNGTQRHQKSMDWKQQTREEKDRQMDTGAGSGD